MKRKARELTYERECGPEDVLYTFFYEVEPFVRGKLNGPPEDCYPDEGGFASVYKIERDGTEIPDTDWEALGIDIKKIEEKIYEACAESQGDDDPPDPRED